MLPLPCLRAFSEVLLQLKLAILMTKSASSTFTVALAVLTLAASVSGAYAGAVIVNPAGTLALGINNDGSLNFGGGPLHTVDGPVGISIIDGGVLHDASSAGCLCEGWGVSGNGIPGFANVDTDSGANNLTINSFTSTASSAVSTAQVTSLPNLVISQNYFPAPEAPNNHFQDVITITNKGSTAITDVRYARVIDWDIPPTPFQELVTIQGTATTTKLATSHVNGFETANPMVQTNPGFPQTLNKDFKNFGPGDIGTYFNFHFGTLAAGQSLTFSLYYGAALSEASMLDALRAVDIELYSLGKSSTPNGPSLGTPYTFSMGFKDVGGIPILASVSSPVPEPGTYGLMGAAVLSGLIAFRRRRAFGAQ